MAVRDSSVSLDSVLWYVADVWGSRDYYPFGMMQGGRNLSVGGYRYGFNGMEDDGEVNGFGNSYYTMYRQYDPRLGKWLSLDPKKDFQPAISPYVGINNSPIMLNDPNGDIAPAVWAAILYALETGAETSVDMALGILLSYLTGIPYTGLDVVADYATNLIPAWGETRTVKKFADIGIEITRISKRVSKIPGAQGVINRTKSAFEQLKNADGVDSFKETFKTVKGALFEFKMLNKYGDDLVGVSVKKGALFNGNILNISEDVITKLKNNLGTNFEFDLIAKGKDGILEFIEVASKNVFLDKKSWDQLGNGQTYLIGKFDKFKKLKEAGVKGNFTIVIDEARSELRKSIEKVAKEEFGIAVKVLSE